MNKSTIAAIGFLAGVTAGAVGSYFITKKVTEDRYEDYIEELTDHFREKMKSQIEEKDEDAEESEEEESDPEQDKIDNNKGVKTYHRPVMKDLENTYNKVVDEIKEGHKMTETERVAELNPTTDPIPGIVEISDQDYMVDQGYAKKSLNYFCEDDKLRLENEDGTIGDDAYIYFRQEYRADSYEDVIGKYLRWAPDYIPEDEDHGYLYVRNENLKIDFEITIFEGAWYTVIDEDTGEVVKD